MEVNYKNTHRSGKKNKKQCCSSLFKYPITLFQIWSPNRPILTESWQNQLFTHRQQCNTYDRLRQLRRWGQKSHSKHAAFNLQCSDLCAGHHVVIHLLTHAFFSRLLPSGDSSCTYVPVKYRWTKADFPLDRFPTIPCKSKSKKLWDDVQVQVTWQRKRKKILPLRHWNCISRAVLSFIFLYFLSKKLKLQPQS